MIETKSQHNLSLGNKKIPAWQMDVLILGLWYFIYFLFMLGSRHLSIPDEGRYPEIAREMLTSGNWVTPTINGVPFLDKHFMDVAMRINPEDKMCGNGKMEKAILRESFEGYLPKEILWRQMRQGRRAASRRH